MSNNCSHEREIRSYISTVQCKIHHNSVASNSFVARPEKLYIHLSNVSTLACVDPELASVRGWLFRFGTPGSAGLSPPPTECFSILVSTQPRFLPARWRIKYASFLNVDKICVAATCLRIDVVFIRMGLTLPLASSQHEREYGCSLASESRSVNEIEPVCLFCRFEEAVSKLNPGAGQHTPCPGEPLRSPKMLTSLLTSFSNT